MKTKDKSSDMNEKQHVGKNEAQKDGICQMEDSKENIKSNKENTTINNEIKNLNIKIKELQDQLLRSLAEIQNIQKRALIEKENTAKFAISNFAKDILIVRDNLYLAINNCQDKDTAIVDGIKLTLSQLDKVMDTYNIKIIPSLGEIFNPNVHQAVSEIESDKNAGTILKVMQEGFTINDRLLRPALVEVSKGSC